MSRLLFYLLIAVMIGGCGTQSKIARKAKRIQVLERQINALGGTVTKDTVYVTQRIIVPETRVDSVVQVKEWTDTIYVTKDRVKTKILVRPVEKTVYVSSKCDTVTIIKRVPVVVNRQIKVGDTGWRDFWQYAGAGLIGLVFGFVACWVLKTFKVIP